MEIGQMTARAARVSSLSAVVYDDGKGVHLRVYYQTADSHVIAELANDGFWHAPEELLLAGALSGTGIAVVSYDFQNQRQLRLYYQAADLSLKEHCRNNSGWFAGVFNPGKATCRTPLCAIAFVKVQLQVYWRDLDGRVVFSRNAGSWGAATAIEGIGPSYQFSVIQWGSGNHLRVYYQNFGGVVAEICSDDGGKTWFDAGVVPVKGSVVPPVRSQPARPRFWRPWSTKTSRQQPPVVILGVPGAGSSRR